MSTQARLSALEQAMLELAHAQARTQENLDRLSIEMRGFKDEMRVSEDRSQRRLDEMGRQWGELSNKMGTLAEDIVAPSIPEVFRRSFPDERPPDWSVRVHRRHESDPGRTREFDVIAFGDRVVLVNETKSVLKPGDIPAFIEVLQEARNYLFEAAGRKVVGALASFYVDPTLVRSGERQGLLMLGLSRGIVEVLNAPGFEPRRF